MTHVVHKLESLDTKEIWQTERGSSFGYQNLVVDMRSFGIMNESGHPTIIDATHSVQLPGAGNATSGGQREFVPLLARAAWLQVQMGSSLKPIRIPIKPYRMLQHNYL